MLCSRAATRASRAFPRGGPQRLKSRLQSSSTSPSTSGHSSSSNSSHPALVGALAGGATAIVVGYGFYHYSGAKKAVSAVTQTQNYMDSAHSKFKQEIQDKAPNPSEALKWLRQIATYYAGFVPGASGVINSSFDDIEKIHDKHSEQVDKILREAAEELKGVSQKGITFESAHQTWEVLQKHFQRIGELGGDAFAEIVDNHPQLKSAIGGNVDKLKSLGESYGPEAKKVFDQTYQQIQDIAKDGISADSIDKIRKLVQEKVAQVQKLGDEAWKKGLEKAKPYLDKNPKVKELVENNADALKLGNVEELWSKVKQTVESGDTSDLQKFADKAREKASSASGGLNDVLSKIPGAGQILPKLGQLQEVAKSKGPEAQKLMEQTVHEIIEVLSKKSKEAEKLAQDAKNASDSQKV